MTATLTAEQRRALLANDERSPVPVLDEETGATYYLVRPEYMELVRQLFENSTFDVESAYPLMNEVAANEGWNDAEMDAYDQLDPRRLP